MAGIVAGMKIRATTELKHWDEHDYDAPEGSPKLAEIQSTYAYSGDLEAESTARGLMVYRDEGHAEFGGLERVSGRVGGRTGTFVVRTGGVYDSGVVTYDWTIVPGTATGDLSGLTGAGELVWAHGEPGNLTFTCELPDPPAAAQS